MKFSYIFFIYGLKFLLLYYQFLNCIYLASFSSSLENLFAKNIQTFLQICIANLIFNYRSGMFKSKKSYIQILYIKAISVNSYTVEYQKGKISIWIHLNRNLSFVQTLSSLCHIVYVCKHYDW